MISLATTTIDVFRGVTVDAYQDVVDVNTSPIATKLPASVIERTRVVFDPASGTPRTVRYVVGRVGHGTDVKVGDRLRDRSGQFFVVRDTATPSNPAIALDLRLDLVRVGNA